MGGMRNTARFRASEGVHERRDQVWGEGNNRVERRTGCPRGAGPSTGCVGRAGNQQIGPGQLEIPRGWVVSRDGVVAKNLHAFMLHTTTLAGFPAACDQSDGSPRSPCNLHAALHRNCRLTGATHGGWSTPKILRLLALYLRKGRNGPCFAFRPSDFPCAYAGSDGCPVFKRETSPVKWCGLYTGAAVRGRSVPLEEVHLAEIQA
jgi:hypothetical protein